MFQPDKELTLPEIAHPCLPTWRKRVDEAEQRHGFSTEELHLAKYWKTCACGEAKELYGITYVSVNVDAINETYVYSMPQDGPLQILGKQFYEQGVRCHNYRLCRELLDAIERRLGELVSIIDGRELMWQLGSNY